MRTVFRSVAIAEAITWLLLLSAMFAKYVTESEPFGIREGGVPVAGMLHGIVFVLFVVTSCAAWRRFGWSTKVLLLAFVSAVVPLATYVFEVRADHRGLLGRANNVNSV
jgi:integral membrane protein